MTAKNSLVLGEYEFTAYIESGYKMMKFPCEYSLSWKLGTEKVLSSKSISSNEDGTMIFEDELRIIAKIAKNPDTNDY
jgi:hypothetical protein